VFGGLMEDEVKVYIKTMFTTTLPEWDPSYEGVLLYDIENHRWVGGDSISWVIIEEEV
jgi:hypothetical protein